MDRDETPPPAAPRAPLEISVTNFGPISRGKFRVGPMTIFVGPNNSGKTYAALLAHSVLSCLSARASPWSLASLIGGRLKDPAFRRLVSEMGSLARSASSGRKRVPPALSRQVCGLVGAHFTRDLGSAMEGNFGIGLASLVRAGTRSSQIRISGGIAASLTLRRNGSLAGELELPEARYSIAEGAGDIAVYVRKSDGASRDIYYHDDTAGGRTERTLDMLEEPENRGLGAVVALFMKIEQLFLSRPTSSYYLPAGRSGILSTYDMLLSNIVSSTKYGEGERNAKITGTMSDFVKFFYNVPAQRPPGPKNGKGAIGEMFGGRLVLSRPRFAPTQITYRFDGMEIPIRRASSGIVETAPFQLFQSGTPRADVLVFEEPEAHLHPENQARLAKHITRLVNDGTHVILVTHGIYFLEQLSMLVRMSKITPAERKKLGFEGSDFINNDDVDPYMFKPAPKGGYTIHKSNHSAEEGIWQDEFIGVTESMYAKDAKITQFLDS